MRLLAKIAKFVEISEDNGQYFYDNHRAFISFAKSEYVSYLYINKFFESYYFLLFRKCVNK